MTSSRPLCLFLLILMIIGTVKSRLLEISDGVHDINNKNHQNVPFLSMGVSVYGSTTLYGEGKRCESIYGFLPCADTMLEGIFLIVMYSYALMVGEDWLHKGSAAFLAHFGDMKIAGFGDKKIAGSIFRVLMALPRIIVVIVSGVLCTQSEAQNQVAFGVAMYAGSTVISLTGIWGVHVILEKEKLRKLGGSKPSQDSSLPCFLSFLTESGVHINKETRKMAFIMLLSLIPFTVVLLVQVFSGPVTILFALIVSVLSLISYIAYQILNPWIQNWSLAYLKQERFQQRFLQKLPTLTNQSLYRQGEPNTEAIRSIFNSLHLDTSGHLSQDGLKNLCQKLRIEEDEVTEEYAVKEILSYFDTDRNKGLSLKEFEEGCTRWLKKWNAGKDGQFSLQNLMKKLAFKNGIVELAKIDRIMPRILFYILCANDKIVNENGEISQNKVDRVFSSCDKNEDGKIDCDELARAIVGMNLGLGEVHSRDLASDIIHELDTNKLGKISMSEFIEGLKEWIRKAKENSSGGNDLYTVVRDFAIEAWGSGAKTKEEPKKNILYVLIGIVTISLFAGSFIQSVIQFSNALRLPFLFTSFVVAPFFMNARSVAIFAFSAASRNTSSNKNASLTFFELYGGLVMNNLMGLTTLLIIVYIRGLTWDYSAEVVTIIMIGLIQGVFASFRTTYPLWTSIVSFCLYGTTICLFCFYAWERA